LVHGRSPNRTGDSATRAAGHPLPKARNAARLVRYEAIAQKLGVNQTFPHRHQPAPLSSRTSWAKCPSCSTAFEIRPSIAQIHLQGFARHEQVALAGRGACQRLFVKWTTEPVEDAFDAVELFGAQHVCVFARRIPRCVEGRTRTHTC